MPTTRRGARVVDSFEFDPAPDHVVKAKRKHENGTQPLMINEQDVGGYSRDEPEDSKLGGDTRRDNGAAGI
jgi:hypothetical protein